MIHFFVCFFFSHFLSSLLSLSHFIFPPLRSQNDYFYIYVLYAINRPKSERICTENRSYFKKIQDEIGDKLGVNSFLVQPIQRLPKYHVLLDHLFKELGKRIGEHDDSIKHELGACCLACKQMQRLLETVDGSMNINEIVDCEVS